MIRPSGGAVSTAAEAAPSLMRAAAVDALARAGVVGSPVLACGGARAAHRVGSAAATARPPCTADVAHAHIAGNDIHYTCARTGRGSRRPSRRLTRRPGFFFQAEDGIRATSVTGVQTCALPICAAKGPAGTNAIRYSRASTTA